MMASPICIEFIEQALSDHTPFPLSYSDPQQKWLIRTHILTFLLDNPSFIPSFGTFTHQNGVASHLLCLTGPIRTSSSPIPITIWLHQNHPIMSPIVNLHTSHSHRLRLGHPFVLPSGHVTCPYLHTWAHPSSSLSELVRNLGRLFSRDHPFADVAVSPSPSLSRPHASSRREAVDRLVGSTHYDVAAMAAEAAAVWGVREEVGERAGRVKRAVAALEEERRGLRELLRLMVEEADVAVNWLRVNAVGGESVEEVFEVSEEERVVVELVAAERGVEDVMYALERAVEEGLLSFEAYMKQVRVLAREQFGYRAKLVKLRGCWLL